MPGVPHAAAGLLCTRFPPPPPFVQQRAFFATLHVRVSAATTGIYSLLHSPNMTNVCAELDSAFISAHGTTVLSLLLLYTGGLDLYHISPSERQRSGAKSPEK